MCEYGVIVPLKNELEDQLSFQNVIARAIHKVNCSSPFCSSGLQRSGFSYLHTYFK